MVVDADIVWFAISEYGTTVSFKPMLTDSTDTVEIRGCAETLVKVNKMESTLVCIMPLGLPELNITSLVTLSSIPCSLTIRMLQLINSAEAVHVS